MKIAGFVKNSFVDYPGKISSVVFTQGCNMNCWYCHNRHLIPLEATHDEDGNTSPYYDSEAIIGLLKTRRKIIDGVVISGGEPTLQPGLESFVKSLKEAGLNVKLDTNGTNPGLLSRLIDAGMLDYVAMDIKAPIDKYAEICGKHMPVASIEESINILLRGKVEYEFRTTVVPELTEQDIIAMAKHIIGADRYVLQAYRKPLHLQMNMDTESGNKDKDKPLGCKVYMLPHSDTFIRQMEEKCSKYVKKCEVRGLK